MKSRNFIVTFILISVLLFANQFAYGQQDAQELPKLLVFHSPGCHRCVEIKASVMPEIEKRFKGRIAVEYRDITDIENYKFLLSLREKYKSAIEISLPVFFYEGRFLNGKGDVREALTSLLARAVLPVRQTLSAGAVDLIAHFKNFQPLAVAAAGLVDGINPCAFTVIVFFMSFLALQGYRRKELIIIGLSFIFAVFLTYLLIGVGIFNFLYRLKGFWIIAKAVNLGIGILSVCLGVLALVDFFVFKKTQDTDGLILQLPKAVKNRIHSVIGLYHRKEKNISPGAVKLPVYRLVFSAFITGFLVSILEAVCTGQVYLPTITFVLKATALKAQALGYLITYNLMFIIPLFAVFLFALLGATSAEFSLFLKKRLGPIKILMSLLFFSLGVFLIWKG